MLRKQLMENRLRYTYFIMCFLNFTMIVFISSIIYITTKRICDMQEARTFLSMIDYLPKDPMLCGIIDRDASAFKTTF